MSGTALFLIIGFFVCVALCFISVKFIEDGVLEGDDWQDALFVFSLITGFVLLMLQPTMPCQYVYRNVPDEKVRFVTSDSKAVIVYEDLDNSYTDHEAYKKIKEGEASFHVEERYTTWWLYMGEKIKIKDN